MSAHLLHIVEAVGFAIVTIGGIGVSEAVQRSRRRRVAAIDVGPARLPLVAPSDRHRTTSRPANRAGSSTRPAQMAGDPRASATLLPLVGLASAGAASVHLVVMPTHFQEAAVYGAFFLVAAACQLGFAALTLARPTRAVLALGLAGNLGLVLTWLVTRTIAIPLGPAAGSREAFGALDMLATAFELAVAAGAIELLKRPLAAPALRPATWNRLIWPLGAAAAAAVALTAVLAPAT